jgi:hypothetical protein
MSGMLLRALILAGAWTFLIGMWIDTAMPIGQMLGWGGVGIIGSAVFWYYTQ